MERNESVKSRAYRTLRNMANYRSVQADGELDYAGDNLVLRENDELIGVYDNVPGKPETSVFVTTWGIHVRLNEQWQTIEYERIIDVEPNFKKTVTA